MKRRLTALFFAAMLTGMGAMQVTADEADLLVGIAEANADEELLEKYGSMAYRSHEYYADGTIVSSYYYVDEELYACERDGNVFINDQGEVYGFDANEMFPFRYLFIGDSYEAFTEMNCVYPGIACYEDEQLLTSEERDGVLYVETSMSVSENDEEYYVGLGYTLEEGDQLLTGYEADAETLEIQKLTVSLEKSGGQAVMLEELTFIPGAEKYEATPELQALIFAEDCRTVTAVLDPDTEAEETCSMKIAKGCSCIPAAPEGYVWYADEACTQELESNGDTQSDITVYAKRAE